MWQTLGHKNQKLFLEKALKEKLFSHAYLFSGPESIGKRTLALEFARKILGIETQNYDPDLIVVEGNKLKIEDFRTLIGELSLKPFAHAYKVAVIDGFENATDEAANSILKTLEEPNSSTIIILITKNKKQLLPTIVSRAQSLNFNRLNKEEIEEIASKHKDFDHELLKKVKGKIGKYFLLKEDKKLLQSFSEDQKEWQGLKEQSLPERIAAIKAYADLENEDLQKVFENWLDTEYAEFLEKPEEYNNMQLLLISISGLKQNFNKKMVLEKLFMNLT